MCPKTELSTRLSGPHLNVAVIAIWNERVHTYNPFQLQSNIDLNEPRIEIQRFCKWFKLQSYKIAIPKGQLILKCPFGVFKSSTKNEIFSRISSLTSNKGSNQKGIRALYSKLYSTYWMILFWLSETPYKIFCCFLKTKGHFEINWPLVAEE